MQAVDAPLAAPRGGGEGYRQRSRSPRRHRSRSPRRHRSNSPRRHRSRSPDRERHSRRRSRSRSRDRSGRDRGDRSRDSGRNHGRDSGRGRHDRYESDRNRGRDSYGQEHGAVFTGNSGLKDDDARLQCLNDDPRGAQGYSFADSRFNRKSGINTASFDPRSTLCRPEMRIKFGSGTKREYGRPLKHDDVIVVPELFCQEDDWSLYYDLVAEMRELQQQEKKTDKVQWVPWHEGCHLISKGPEHCKTYKRVLDRIVEYFRIKPSSTGTRFNWYRDSSDWKPFHHDSAAFNPQRARSQNITVGVSFGAERELAFLHAHNGQRIYFPQQNGMAFSFGRDVNINWKHGVNALPVCEQDGKGRISIIVWGLVEDVIEEDGSPPMVQNGRGKGARGKGKGKGKGRGGQRGSGFGGRGGGGGPRTPHQQDRAKKTSPSNPQ